LTGLGGGLALTEGQRVLERLRLGMLWLTAVSGGFVFIEPSPYEIISVAAILLFLLGGHTLRPGHLPLAALLITYNIGFAIGVVRVLGFDNTLQWTAVSCFLAMTSLFFAVALSQNQRLNAVLAGYCAAAIVVSIIGILAYFHLLPSSETFMFAGRARATFKDPNVFGPFLVLPGLLAIQHILSGRIGGILAGAGMLALIVVALLLSFSRGAWGHFAASALLMLALTFIISGSARERVRIVVWAALGSVAIAAFVVALLSIEQVGTLFQERAALIQDYDAGHTGRFGRHVLGFLMIFDHPIGIGPLQFAKYFPEDPHNSFLDAFMAGGWVGGVIYAALVLLTLAVGLREVFAVTPWQRTYVAIYATYVGVVGESYIIDTNHWRHYFLLVGLIWGLLVVRHAGPARPWFSVRSGAPRRPLHPVSSGASASA
jgi:O-antigen ligase